MIKMIKKKLFIKNFGFRGKSKRPMVNAYGDRCFWIHNGPVLSSLKDLLRTLNSMTNSQYTHHVGVGRNDFAKWVEFVLLDKDCADLLKKALGREKAASAVEKSLKNYLS